MKKKRLMITLLLVISILMFVGFAYAYLAAGVNNDDAQEASITTGTMNLTFADGTSAFQAKEINIGESVTKTFTIENTGTLDATASMYFKDLVNTYLEGSMTYRLEYSENENGPYKLLKAESDVPYSDNFTSQYLKLISNIIKVPAGEKLYYKLIITFNNLQDLDQSADLDAVLNTKFTLLASSNYEYCGESGNEFEYDECFDTIEECERNTFGGCYTQVRERSEYCYIEDDELYCYDSYEDCEYDVSTTDYPDNLCFEKDAEMVSCFNFDSTWTCYSGFQDWCEYDADAYTDFTGPYPNCTSVNFRNQGEILSTEYCFEGECYETLEECRADNYPYVEPGYDCYRVTTHDHDYVVLSESEKTLAALNLTNQVKDELTTYNMFNYTWAGYNPDGKALGIGETQGIYAMEDDFGMSYYFRGPKTLNNIVKFGKYDSDMYYYPISNVEYSTGSLADCQAEASYKEKYCTDEYKFASAGDDMYWRIVRINGDGTLRLMYIGTSPNATGINATAGISSFNRWGSNKKYAGYIAGEQFFNVVYYNILGMYRNQVKYEEIEKVFNEICENPKTKDIIKNYWAKTIRTKIIYNSVKNKNLKKLLFWGTLKGKINKIIGKK